MTRLPRAALVAATTLSLCLGSGILGAPAAQAAPTTPDIVALAGPLASQTLTWKRCDFGSILYNLAWAWRPNVRCADVTVPRDWHDPTNGKTWTVRISQQVNIDPSDPRSKGVILGNPGGPGGDGLVMGPYLADQLPELRPYYNFVGMDPRGVGQSSKASCEYTFDANSTDPYAEKKAIGAQCAQHEDVRTITTEQTAYDMDLIRHLLGHKKLGYIGYSYGTWLGAWYGKVFSANAGPMLLDSSADATEATLQHLWDLQPVARDRQFDMHMLSWIARQDSVYKLGQDPAVIRDRYFAATSNLSQLTVLLTWLPAYKAFSDNSLYPRAGYVVKALIEVGELRGAGLIPDADPATMADQIVKRVEASATDAETRTAAQAAAAPLSELAGTAGAASSDPGTPQMVTRKFTSLRDMIVCGDGQWTQGERYWEAWVKEYKVKTPLSASFGVVDVPTCAFWKTDVRMPAATSGYPATVVVQSELDSQTAYEAGYASGTKLPSTSAIFVDNEGSHGLFPYGTECLDRPVITFFLEGRLPADTAVCQAVPLPREDRTYESWAKLDPSGRHVTTPAGLWAPAETAVRTLPSSDRTLVTVGDATLQHALRAKVQERYGPEGVAILERAGYLA